MATPKTYRPIGVPGGPVWAALHTEGNVHFGTLHGTQNRVWLRRTDNDQTVGLPEKVFLAEYEEIPTTP